MKGTVIADIHTHCGGPVCFNRPYRIRHTVYRTETGWLIECQRCYTSRPATQTELHRAADRVEELALVNQGQEVLSYAV